MTTVERQRSERLRTFPQDAKRRSHGPALADYGRVHRKNHATNTEATRAVGREPPTVTVDAVRVTVVDPAGTVTTGARRRHCHGRGAVTGSTVTVVLGAVTVRSRAWANRPRRPGTNFLEPIPPHER
jgi:hypothetical protein